MHFQSYVVVNSIYLSAVFFCYYLIILLKISNLRQSVKYTNKVIRYSTICKLILFVSIGVNPRNSIFVVLCTGREQVFYHREQFVRRRIMFAGRLYTIIPIFVCSFVCFFITPDSAVSYYLLIIVNSLINY